LQILEVVRKLTREIFLQQRESSQRN
jgi:hypothetical protein